MAAMVNTNPLTVSETIQEIKDAVGIHTEEDILDALKLTNMDADEAVHRLLFQDSFHEVKRKKDKKKEIPVIKRSSEPRKLTEPSAAFKGSLEPRKVIEQNTTFKRSSEPSKPTEQTHGLRPRTFSERNVRRPGYNRSSFPDAGTGRQFRVVRDNRVNQNTNRDAAVQSTTSASGQGTTPIPPRSQVRILTDQRHTGPRNSEGQRSSQTGNGPPSESGHGQFKDTNTSSNNRKGGSDETRAKAPTASASQGPRPRSSNSASNNTVVGLYSSSSDPVHVPSNSRPSGNRHAVGVVGYPRKSSDNSKQTVPSSSTKETSSISQPPPSGSTTVKTNHHHVNAPTSDSTVTNTKSFANKPHQPPTGHQKAPHAHRKWKPKPTTTAVSVPPPPVDHSVEKEAEHSENQISQASINENEHVFIPQHLRVPEADRTHFTFGSFGTSEINSINLENEAHSSEEEVAINHVTGQSESASPASENPSVDVKESSSPNLEAYADMGIVRNNSPPYAPAQPQQHQQQQQDAPLPSYVAYDSQPGYDVPFYRPMTDESLRTHQSVQSPVEALSSHASNSIPPSSLAIPQMYPQVHLSHFPGYMPYRQFIPSVYVPPPMGVPGYTNNPGYPHPQNGSSYLLMPGGSSHMAAATASGLKYGPASQYKPIPAGTPTGFGNYPSPTGYAINTQGAPIGGANGLDDSTRMKFKDGNLYVPNPQAETSELWIQTPREIPGMQSAPYYNIPGQAPHPAYMTAHPGHASFNGAAAVQPTHMQYSGLYHPSPQQAGIANQHHMVQNVGVAGAAPSGAQIGAYQQPQLGHLNWNTNF